MGSDSNNKAIDAASNHFVWHPNSYIHEPLNTLSLQSHLQALTSTRRMLNFAPMDLNACVTLGVRPQKIEAY